MKKILLAVLLASAVFLCSCTSSAETQGYAMSTHLLQRLYGGEAASAAEQNEKTALDIENELSATLPASAVLLLNDGGEGELHGRLAYIMEQAAYFEAFSEGAFSPYMKNIADMWDIGGEDQRVPTEEETSAAAKYIKDNPVVTENGYIYLHGNKIDLGGIAKGYALDEMYKNAAEAGVTGGLIDFGGSICAIGEKPGGGAWEVGIYDPVDETLAAEARLTDAFISTSGAYQKYFFENGEKYFHIFDPETGRPAKNGLASVSVIAKSGIFTDAMSTALFVMGKEKGLEFAEENGIAAVFVCDDGEITATKGAEEYSVAIS